MATEASDLVPRDQQIASITVELIDARPVLIGLRETYQSKVRATTRWMNGDLTMKEMDMTPGDTLFLDTWRPT